jgi:hypothetical protein
MCYDLQIWPTWKCLERFAENNKKNTAVKALGHNVVLVSANIPGLHE